MVTTMTWQRAHTKKTLGLLGATALMFTIAACGDANATADGNSGTTARPTSPLNQIMESVWGTSLSQEEQQRQADERSLRQEELIAQCMNEAGFEYNPNPNSNVTVVSGGDDDMWQPDNRDWVAQWGYGAVNSPWNARWEAEQEARAESGQEDTWFDPNSHLWDTMSETEMAAWQRALWGPPMEELPPGIWDSETGMILDNEAFNEHRGCSGWAWNIVDADSPWQLTQQEEFRPLMDAMNDIWMNVQNDPQFLAIDAEWATCMANAGYPGFTRQADANNSIWDRQSEIQNNIDWENWDWETMGNVGPNSVPELAALGENEIELALADLDCRESVNFRERQEAIQFAAENQFIAEHRAALDALVAAAEQRG